MELQAIAGILMLATLIEGFITYAFGAKPETRPYLKFVSLALGILVSIAYGIDIPAMIGLSSSVPLFGFVVSGLVIGRGANYLNDILSMVRSRT